MCWQRRKGIRQTVWQAKLILFAAFEEAWNILQPNPPPQVTPQLYLIFIERV